MNHFNDITTDSLISHCEAHLNNASYATAREMLDELIRRPDVSREMSVILPRCLHPEYAQLLQDRIDAVNAKVS